jgi:hypothetical protein
MSYTSQYTIDEAQILHDLFYQAEEIATGFTREFSAEMRDRMLLEIDAINSGNKAEADPKDKNREGAAWLRMVKEILTAANI